MNRLPFVRPARRWLAQRSTRQGAVLFALAFALVWSLVEVLVTQLHQAYSLVQVEGVRFGVQLLLMLLLWTWRGDAGQRWWRSRRAPWHVLRGLSMLALPFAFAAAVYSGVSIPLALSGLWFAPLFALALAALWLRERPAAVLWLGALAGLGAVLLLFQPALPGSLAALLMPLLSGAALAVYLALTRLLRDEPVQTGLFFVAAVGLLVLLPFLPGVWVRPSGRDLALLAGVGAFGYLALWLLDQALRRWSLSHLAPLLYAHVLVLQWLPGLLRGQWPSWRLVLASALVGGVVTIVWWRASARRVAGVGTRDSALGDSVLGAPVSVRGGL
ncbi:MULTISPECIES: EamA family transporter [unclassified Hydrogenophaga]|uniref:EamA family transporter n=1 Tax=unclassified Hydrogenophaga TaxID=2610897 RepID=UPI0008788874|nr:MULTISPECIES: EamA family transporter [unclassified Hydrogenophaga]MBN9373333.1 EamA family transporter [Hydrogenophaga sp.]OJV66140.1 MAG: hypothetical protein BGO22_19025 [Hydrogenophaga sp. 70-12]